MARVLQAVRLSAHESKREETAVAEASIRELGKKNRDLHEALATSYEEKQDIIAGEQSLFSRAESQSAGLQAVQLRLTEESDYFRRFQHSASQEDVTLRTHLKQEERAAQREQIVMRTEAVYYQSSVHSDMASMRQNQRREAVSLELAANNIRSEHMSAAASAGYLRQECVGWSQSLQAGQTEGLQERHRVRTLESQLAASHHSANAELVLHEIAKCETTMRELRRANVDDLSFRSRSAISKWSDRVTIQQNQETQMARQQEETLHSRTQAANRLRSELQEAQTRETAS